MINNLFLPKKHIKKIWLVLGLLLLAVLFSLPSQNYVSATETNNMENLSQSVTDIVDNINVSEIENLVKDIETLGLFDGSVKDKLNQILNGEYFTNYTSVFSAIISIFISNISDILPFFLTLIAIGILGNIINGMGNTSKSNKNIINFVFLSIVVIMVLMLFKSVINTTNSVFESLISQMQVVFPILITMLSTIGSFTAVSIYNPLVGVLTFLISVIFNKFLYPIFIVIFIFTVLSNLTNTIKLDKLTGFLSSTFKWTIGLVFTLFSGFLSIQGISAGRFDSVSIKATKFAMKSYIPIIGSYVSEGIDFFILGATLVKNAIGLIGVLILFITIISPLITILIYKLMLQLCSGILELCGNTKISSFLSGCSKILILPIVLIVGIAFMYVITICLIMCTANIL